METILYKPDRDMFDVNYDCFWGLRTLESNDDVFDKDFEPVEQTRPTL